MISECSARCSQIGRPCAGRVAVDATAFPQRSSHFVMNVHARWREPKLDQECIGWARQLFEAAKPHAAGTAYINFMPEDEVDRVEAAYGGNYRRLAEVKRRYDPQNLYRMNQNVTPV
jgi:Berberine and berberine like